MLTSAPGCVFEFLQFTNAKFFSSKFFPINIPNPRPLLILVVVFMDLRYGSPIFESISLGYPAPSSSIIISVYSLLLFNYLL